MKTNSVLIDLNAILEITKNRNFTNCEFEEGAILFNYLMGDIDPDVETREAGKLLFSTYKNNLYITSGAQKARKGLIIDTQTFQGFKQQKNSALYLFQKVIRLAYRHFYSHPHIPCEQFFPDKGMFILFPFQGSNKYRMVIATDVDKKRQEPRNNKYLLLFNGGIEIISYFVKSPIWN